MSAASEAIGSLLAYNPDTGVFTLRTSGASVGYLRKDGYCTIWLHGRHQRAHRLAWLLMTGEWPSREIDHINGIRNDNRWINLREASSSQNKANAALSAKNTSGLKGVGLHRGKWRAVIRVDKRLILLGYFATPEEAHVAYCDAAKAHFGEFARFA